MVGLDDGNCLAIVVTVGAVLSKTKLSLLVPVGVVLTKALPATSVMSCPPAKLKVTVPFKEARSPPEAVTR